MRKNFFVVFALLLWLLMVVGFSDNWLFDTGQPSNSQPKFLIHAVFAFFWFSALVLQAALIRTNRKSLHMKTGVFGMLAYYLMTITIWALFFEKFVQRDSISELLKPLELLSVVLVTLGFLNRKKNANVHKDYIVFGTFCLVGPGLDRSAFHLFGADLMTWPMIMGYLGLFGLFAWYKKSLTWYMALWVLAWTYSLYPMLIALVNGNATL